MKLKTLFKQTILIYFGSKRIKDPPALVIQSGYFVIYVDISQMYPSMDQKFDGNDWTLIHKTKKVVTPNTSVTLNAPATASSSGGLGQGNVTTTNVTATNDPRLMTTLAKLIDSGCEHKQVPSKPWDATTRTETPTEVIKHNTNKLKPNYFMTKNEMAKFNNELTKKNDGTPKNRPYVLVPLTGSGYLIFHDGTLYCFLFSQKKESRKLFDNFLKLKDMNHCDWYDFYMELEIHAFTNCTFVLPYHCQQRN